MIKINSRAKFNVRVVDNNDTNIFGLKKKANHFVTVGNGERKTSDVR